MKKRITAVISLILAFVMCFALVACNGEGAGTADNKPDGPAKPNKPAVVTSVRADKVATAFEQLTEVSGFKGEAKIDVTSDKHNYNYSLTFDKRGDRVMCNAGESSFILDLETGNLYSELSDGKYDCNQYLPIGALDYLEYMLGQLPAADGKTDLSDITLSYDEATKTATYKKDIAGELNDYLEPISDAYEYKKTVIELIDAYIGMFNEDMTVDGILAFVAAFHNMTVDEVVTMLEVFDMGADITDILRGAIDEYLDEDTAEKLYRRKVGEIVAGVYYFVTEMRDSQTPDQPTPDEEVSTQDDDTAPVEGEEPVGGEEGDDPIAGIIGMQPAIEEMMGALFDAVVNREFTADEVNAAVKNINNLLEIARNIKVTDIVDKYVPNISEELYAAIVNGVSFSKLGAECSIGLDINDDVYTVTGFEFTAQCKHNYSGEAGEGWTVLADNNFKAFVSVTIGEYYTTASEDFEITVSPDAQTQTEILAFTYGMLEEDYDIKFELGNSKITGSWVYSVRGTSGDGEYVDYELYNGGTVITSVGSPRLMRLDKDAINSAFISIGHGGSNAVGVGKLVIYANLLIPDAEDMQLKITLIKMPDTVEGLLEVLKGMVPEVPETPDMPGDDTPIEGETEA